MDNVSSKLATRKEKSEDVNIVLFFLLFYFPSRLLSFFPSFSLSSLFTSFLLFYQPISTNFPLLFFFISLSFLPLPLFPLFSSLYSPFSPSFILLSSTSLSFYSTNTYQLTSFNTSFYPPFFPSFIFSLSSPSLPVIPSSLTHHLRSSSHHSLLPRPFI